MRTALVLLVIALPALAGGEQPEDPTENLIGETEEVIVVDSPPPPARGTSSEIQVSARALTLAPVRTADELVRMVPGVHISQHGSDGKAQQFFVRGFDAVHGSDVEVRVGALPVNELSNVHGTGYVDLGFLLPEVALGVRADKGSYRLDQGNFATAGSVNIDLGVAAGRRGVRTSYELGSTNRHRLVALWAPRGQDEQTFAALGALYDDGFGQNRTSENLTGLAQKRLSLGGATLDITGGAYAARFGEPGVTPIALVDSGDVDFYDSVSGDTGARSSRAFVSARLSRTAGSARTVASAFVNGRSLRLEENFTGSLQYGAMGDAFRQRHRSLSGGGRFSYDRKLSPWLTLMTGADALIDRMSQDETQIDSAGVPWQDNRDLAATHLLGAARVGTDLRLGSLGRLRAGVRLDGARIAADDQMTGSDGSDTMAALSPRLAFELWPADRATVTLAYGRGLRLPEAAAIAADPSMPGALPVAIARSDNAELGAKVQIADGLVLQTAAFGSWLSSEVIFDHAVGRTIARGTTRRLGVEAAIRYQLAPWMELRSDITAVDGRFTDSDEEIPNAPRLVASAGGEAMHPSGFMGSALFRYIGARPLAFGATGQQQAVLDLSAGYRTSRYEIRALIDNALGSEFREAEFNYASDFGGGSTSNLPQLHYSPGRPLSGRLVLTAWF